MEAATLCGGGCNPATRVGDGGCNLMMVLSGMPEKVPVAARWRRMPGLD
jgi:hypothetical protein